MTNLVDIHRMQNPTAEDTLIETIDKLNATMNSEAIYATRNADMFKATMNADTMNATINEDTMSKSMEQEQRTQVTNECRQFRRYRTSSSVSSEGVELPDTMWKRIKLAVSQKFRRMRETVSRIMIENQAPEREVLVNERLERRPPTRGCAEVLNCEQCLYVNNVRRPLINGEERLPHSMWIRIRLAVSQSFRRMREIFCGMGRYSGTDY